MALLLRYQRTDGQIRGVLSSSVSGMLDPQGQPDDPDYGFVLYDGPETGDTLQARYAVRDGAVQPKQVVTLTATAAMFPADGVSVCRITVVPFVPCVVLVNGVPYSLVEEDQVLELTSDTPQVFGIVMQQQALVWAADLRVEAF